MSIIITNKGQAPGENETTRIYHININDKLITEFTHDREDGLAECLRKAAIAIEDKTINDLAKSLVDITIASAKEMVKGIPTYYTKGDA